MIINITGKYQPYIREWSRLQVDQQSWANFKTHFRQVHQKLREAGDIQIRDTQFNSANIVQEVIEGVQSILQPSDTIPDTANEVITQMANNDTPRQMMSQTMNQMVRLLQQISTVQQQLNLLQRVPHHPSPQTLPTQDVEEDAPIHPSIVGHIEPVHMLVHSVIVRKQIIRMQQLSKIKWED